MTTTHQTPTVPAPPSWASLADELPIVYRYLASAYRSAATGTGDTCDRLEDLGRELDCIARDWANGEWNTNTEQEATT